MKTRSIAGWILVVSVACTSGSDSSSEPQGSGATSATGSPSGDGARDGSEDDGGTGGSDDLAPERSATAVTERPGDATSSGDVEGYPELTEATLTGSEQAVSVDLGFAAEVPQRTPSATQMLIALSIIDREGARYVLNAMGTEEGWSTVVLTSEGRAEFPGDFAIGRRTVRVVVPWSELGGPRPFRWIASASWTGDPSKGTSYAFDSIPNRGFALFPDPEKSP